MLRSGLRAVLRPLARSAQCLHYAPTMFELRTQQISSSVRTHCRQLSLASHSPRLASSKESVEDPYKPSESVTIKQYLSTLTAQQQEEYATSELQKLSPQDEKCLRVAELEYDVWMSTGVRVPEEMTKSMWFQILHTQTRKARQRLYGYWFKREWAVRNDNKKKIERQKEHLKRQTEKRAQLEEMAREEGLPEGKIPFKNSIFMFVRQATMLRHHYNNMAWAMQFGQPLIMDLSLEVHMRNRERTSLIRQLLQSYSINKVQQEPFNLVMTGLAVDGLVDRKLKGTIGDMDVLPLTITSKSYLDLYPVEQLVYLTPDSPNELLSWSPDDIYIVGALVDLTSAKPVTLAKAKSQKLRTARFPLESYLLWKQGIKTLTLDTCMRILCNMKDTGDWTQAFQHIPNKRAEIRPQVKKQLQNKK